jgi:predicted nuclease with TOPRIM domain
VLGPVYIENLHYEHHEHRYAEDANLKYYQTQVTRDQSQLDETRTAYEQIRKERDTLKASFDAVQSEMNRYKIGYSTEFEQHKATKGEKEQLSKRVSDLEQEKYVFQINELELRKQLEHAKRGWQICYDSNKTRNASRTGL